MGARAAGADGRGHITSGGATLTEEDTPSPEDPYAVSKYATELDLRAAKEMFGMDFVIFRPHNVYGPRQNLHDAYRVSDQALPALGPWSCSS